MLLNWPYECNTLIEMTFDFFFLFLLFCFLSPGLNLFYNLCLTLNLYTQWKCFLCLNIFKIRTLLPFTIFQTPSQHDDTRRRRIKKNIRILMECNDKLIFFSLRWRFNDIIGKMLKSDCWMWKLCDVYDKKKTRTYYTKPTENDFSREWNQKTHQTLTSILGVSFCIGIRRKRTLCLDRNR